MTNGQRLASIARHQPFLTPAEQKQFEPSEAEKLAADRTYAIAKDSGALFRLEMARALQRQINEERS